MGKLSYLNEGINNLLGSMVGAGVVGASALGSEDADAGIISSSVDDVARLLQMGMLKTDTAQAAKTAKNKYDKMLIENPGFAHREEMAGDSQFRTIRDQHEFESPILTADDLMDHALVPVRTDRSMIGTVDQVGGIGIPRTDIEGGYQYPMKHGHLNHGWQSMAGVAKGQHNKFKQVAEETGKPVLAVVNAMGPDSINFSTAIAEQMHKQMPLLSKIPDSDKKAFDAELSKLYPDWPGVDHPESMSWLMGTDGYDNIGKRRTAYSTIMGKAGYRNKGFPNYKEALDAATHSDLTDLALGDSGLSIYKPDLSQDVFDWDGHKSYSTVMPGEIAGRLEETVPFSEIFAPKYDSLRLETTKGKTGPKNFTNEQAIDAMNKRKDGYVVADGDWRKLQRGNADPAPLAALAGGSGLLATADKWAAPVNDAAEFVFDALEVPVRGWHGIAGVLGELARSGDIESALANGGKYASQSIDDTASDYGRAVADETGSPLAAALTHALTQMASPI